MKVLSLHPAARRLDLVSDVPPREIRAGRIFNPRAAVLLRHWQFLSQAHGGERGRVSARAPPLGRSPGLLARNSSSCTRKIDPILFVEYVERFSIYFIRKLSAVPFFANTFATDMFQHESLMYSSTPLVSLN